MLEADTTTVSMDSDESTELSSISSEAPSPPPQFPPSPESSQDLAAGSDQGDKKRKRDGDNETAAPKKRKRPEPKPRTTERLNLTGDVLQLAIDQKSQLEKLLKVLRKRRKIVVIAGAGISVSAGSTLFASTPSKTTR